MTRGDPARNGKSATLVLAAFVLVAGEISRGGSAIDGTPPFIWVWLPKGEGMGAPSRLT
jgi:hypothetical protein